MYIPFIESRPIAPQIIEVLDAILASLLFILLMRWSLGWLVEFGLL